TIELPSATGTTVVPLAYDASTRRHWVDWDTRPLAEGPATLRVAVTDSARRSATASRVVEVTNKPAISITAPTTTVVQGTTAITATVTSSAHAAAEVVVRWEAGAASGAMTRTSGSTFTGTWDTTASPEGPVALRVIATDPTGRSRTVTRDATVRN